jgi:hypothetical protein
MQASTGHDPRNIQVMHACNGTTAPVCLQQSAVSTDTSVPTVGTQTISTVPAPINPKQVRITDSVNKPPRSSQSFYWEGNVEGISHLALISESLLPLPCVLDDKLKNNVITKTILDNNHLFSIVTPVNISHLTWLLINHPNQPFVSFVL